MTNSIHVEFKNVYGNELIYPICNKAKALARIAGQKTLTRATLRNCKDLEIMVLVVDAFGRPCCEMQIP